MGLAALALQGGARATVKSVGELIDTGQLGRPLVERIELVRQIHEVLSNNLERGGRRATVDAYIGFLNDFFRWADESNGDGNELSLASVEQSYHRWTDSLLHRVRVGKDFKETSAYSAGRQVGAVLDRVLGRGNPIIRTTHLRRPKPSPRAVSPKADKQNLAETFALGHFLLDLADGLGVEAIWGPLPVHIPLRNGKSLEEWSRLQPADKLKPDPLKSGSSSISL
jgi:hypothetical protein